MFILLIVLIGLCGCYEIATLNEDNFKEKTLIGVNSSQLMGERKDWFIMFHKDSEEKMFDFWNEVAKKFGNRMEFGQVDCGLYEDLRDHFTINIFPSFMYFPKDEPQMHPFIGYRTLENITDWVDNQRWKVKVQYAQEIPQKINYSNRIWRYIFHPYSLISLVAVFVLILVFICTYEDKDELQRLRKARVMKVEYIKRRQEMEQMGLKLD